MAKGHSKCGLIAALVFLSALASGTGCSLTSKVLLGITATNEDGEEQEFSKPIFQTMVMFLGMVAALPFHWAAKYFDLPFPGYPAWERRKQRVAQPANYKSISKDHEGDDSGVKDGGLSMEMYFMLIFPSAFDLSATALCMLGLQYINVSSYQILRGSSIVFVALMKHFWIGDRLRLFKWIGVGWNVVSIMLVGATVALEGRDATPGSFEINGNYELLGVVLILCGALVQSLQYAFEERVMSLDSNVSPLLLVGMEGVWGLILSVFVVYPVVAYIPGKDEGSFESPWNTYYMLKNNEHLQYITLIYVSFIFIYNLTCVTLTFLLDSVWHAILDNFRPITVWSLDLWLFYWISADFGEAWTNWSYLQLVAMALLLYGTALYNAPNPGSIKLRGRMVDCLMDFTEEYDEVTKEQKQGDFGGVVLSNASPFQQGSARRSRPADPAHLPTVGKSRPAVTRDTDDLEIQGAGSSGRWKTETRRRNSE